MGRPKGSRNGQHAHGTNGGYIMHQRNKALPCIPCLRAHAVYEQKRRDKGRCARGLGWPLQP